MTAGFEIYDTSGNVIMTNNSKILKVDEFRTTKVATNGIWPKYYYNGAEESNKTVLVRPQVVGEEMLASTVYSNAIPYAEIQSYLAGTNTPTNKVEVAVCSITDAVSTDAKYLSVFGDDGTVSFDLNTFIKGVRVVHYSIVASLMANTWYTITLPDNVNVNNLFILLPYSHIFNADNGTDSVYSASALKFKFTSAKTFHYMVYAYRHDALTFSVADLPLVVLEVVR